MIPDWFSSHPSAGFPQRGDSLIPFGDPGEAVRMENYAKTPVEDGGSGPEHLCPDKDIERFALLDLVIFK